MTDGSAKDEKGGRKLDQKDKGRRGRGSRGEREGTHSAAAAAGGPPGQLVGNYLVDADDVRGGKSKRSQSTGVVRTMACQTEVLDALTPLPPLGRQLEPSARQNAKDPAG